MPAHIGIAACSAEGAALCYRTICAESIAALGRLSHPEVSMHTPDLADYMAPLERDDWPAVAEVMLDSARRLAGMGADFVICPDNTVHQSLPWVLSRSPLPWLHIAEVVADAARGRGMSCLGLTGTRWLVDSEVYPEKLAAYGIRYQRPTPEQRDEISRIIMQELVPGQVLQPSVDYFCQVISDMKASGCDGVVLGCTEIPLIINDDNSPLPVLDSTRLLARAALDRAMHHPEENTDP
ncbi:MAG: amino acid racemase [Xanthomonadales bacterium]|nr:amino acid racemase [Xanthomonadales bacterium]